MTRYESVVDYEPLYSPTYWDFHHQQLTYPFQALGRAGVETALWAARQMQDAREELMTHDLLAPLQKHRNASGGILDPGLEAVLSSSRTGGYDAYRKRLVAGALVAGAVRAADSLTLAGSRLVDTCRDTITTLPTGGQEVVYSYPVRAELGGEYASRVGLSGKLATGVSIHRPHFEESRIQPKSLTFVTSFDDGERLALEIARSDPQEGTIGKHFLHFTGMVLSPEGVPRPTPSAEAGFVQLSDQVNALHLLRDA